jgi:hypothetical protein
MSNPYTVAERESRKEPYATPELARHGDIAELTRGAGGPAADVGAQGSFLSTAPTPNP